MSKTNKVQEDMDEIAEFNSIIEEMILKARNRVFNILVKVYGYDEKEARKIEESINASTISAMRDRYTFHDGQLTYNFGKYNKQYGKLIDNFPDFFNWAWTGLGIPFYHSLGDTIGYYNGKWEFNYGNIREGPEYVNELIAEFIDLGGINDLNIEAWRASDDTILYLATLDILATGFENIDDFGAKIKKAYVATIPTLKNRHAGIVTTESLKKQKQSSTWNTLAYDSKANGAGSAMRSGCIGIFFPGADNRKRLIAFSIESSRITHNSAIAMLGSITSALFTAYSLERVPINKWPHKLIKLIESGVIDEYLKMSRPAEYKSYNKDKIKFIGQWKKYIDLLFVDNNPKLDFKMMKNPVQRYKYLAENFSKGCDIPGSCADDATIMAYDSLVRSNGTLEKLLVYSVLHPGDSDTVGSIAFGWFGGYFGSPRNDEIIKKMKKDLEFYNKISETLDYALPIMIKVYFYDIYLNLARTYLKPYIKNNK